jgi:hypothetical protein
MAEGTEKVNGLNLVPPAQNYVDLIALGGIGADVAKRLADKYKLGV